MPFIQGKCENCGGFLTVDPNYKTANCPYCGTPYIISNNISSDSVQKNNSSDFIIEVGVLKAYKGASTDVVIPNGVTVIGEGAFRGLGITSVYIPQSVVKIHSYAFCDCVSLKEITLPNTTSIIAAYTFKGCINLHSISIPDSVTKIENYAFADCYKLAEIMIPNSVSYIDEFAFVGCANTRINWPTSYVDKQLSKLRIAARMFNKSIGYLPKNLRIHPNTTLSLLYDGEEEYFFCELEYFRKYHIRRNPVTNYDYCVVLDIQKVYASLTLLLDRAGISREIIKEIDIPCFGRDRGSVKNGMVKNLLIQIKSD